MLRTTRAALAIGVPLLLAAWPAAAAPDPSTGIEFADTMDQRLLACSGCHGKQGEGSRQNEYYPRIAGKPAEYLYRQLVNFRNGRRTYPQMVYFSRHLSDEYLREIATYYSKLTPPFPTPIQPSATKDVLARGEAIVRNGDPGEGHPRVRCVPRQGAHRHAAGDSRAGRALSRLHQRPDRRMAQRPAARQRARLHGEDLRRA